MKVLITGGAGFIGAAVVRHVLAQGHSVGVLDAMTYSASPDTLKDFTGRNDYFFFPVDICDSAATKEVLESFRPDVIMHLAAESHVDRSIEGPSVFVMTNVVGTQRLLDCTLAYWEGLPSDLKRAFRFHHISTDEVFGSLGDTGAFSEATRYDPRSPYSASKAASDHLVRAWYHTYGLPVLLTNCSNNYGPYQFPEKLIPLTVLRGLGQETLPVYGNGSNVRDWLFVEDHARALWRVIVYGRVGETYGIGGRAERRNIDVVRAITAALDEMVPAGAPHERLIAFVQDRPGHDQRYAIDPAKIENELGWKAANAFEDGLRQTIRWYLDNKAWWGPILERHSALARLGSRC